MHPCLQPHYSYKLEGATFTKFTLLLTKPTPSKFFAVGGLWVVRCPLADGDLGYVAFRVVDGGILRPMVVVTRSIGA